MGEYVRGHSQNDNTAYVAMDKHTKKLFIFHKDELKKFSNTKRHKELYKIMGIFGTAEEAENFAAYLSLGIAPDAVAFLTMEHECREKIADGADVSTNDLENMLEKVNNIQEETGRACFGNCGSIRKQTACAICYESIPDTWRLCANVTCLKREYAFRKATEKAESVSGR